jgi:hypothetical protein
MIKQKNNKGVKANAKKDFLSKVMPIVISAAIGALIGISSDILLKDFFDAAINSDDKLLEIFRFCVLVLLFIAGYLIHIIIHEAGHLVFGLMTGYSFVSFRIASFTIIKEEDKLKHKRLNIPGTAGQCLMMPPTLKNSKYPFVIYNYGGVMMNLIVSLLQIILATFMPSTAFPIDAILVITATGGILAALTNGIPMKLSGVPNDAYNVFSMLKDEEAKKSFYVALKVNGLLTLGERIKDIPFETFSLEEDSDLCNPLNTAIRLMEYSWHIDNMDFESAKQCIDSLIPYIDKIPLLFKNEVNCERIFLELTGSCHKALIDELYDKGLKKYVMASKFLIAKKRFLMAYEGFYNENRSKALEHYEAAKKLAPKYPIKGEANTELLIMEWIRGRLN